MIIVIIVIIGPIFILTLCTALFITLGNWYHSSSLAISWFSWLMNHEITIIAFFTKSDEVYKIYYNRNLGIFEKSDEGG